MPPEVLAKIQYLCKKIYKVEWSGILLYKVQGSIKDPDSMVIILKDIIPMHKGSSTYTEYKYNEPKRNHTGIEDRHIDYCNINPEALDWKIGHIHSHNTMDVFFSGTDIEEIYDNSASHDFYLSLIVNNFMDFEAKIAFRAKTYLDVPVEYTATDENGEIYTIEKSIIKDRHEKVFIYNCVIDSPINIPVLDEIFLNTVDSIIRKSNKPVHNNSKYKSKTKVKPKVVYPLTEEFEEDVWIDPFDDNIEDQNNLINKAVINFIMFNENTENFTTITKAINYVRVKYYNEDEGDLRDTYLLFYDEVLADIFGTEILNPIVYKRILEVFVNKLRLYEDDYDVLSLVIEELDGVIYNL